MDLLDVLGVARSPGCVISPFVMALIGALAYDALKGQGRLADTLGVELPSGGGFRELLSGETGRNVLTTGLRDLLDRFRRNGQWDRAQSWIAIGPNRPIAPHELAQALGEDCVRWLIQETKKPPFRGMN